MDLHDYLNVRRILRLMAKEWNCPVWLVKRTVQQIIDRNWENAQSVPEEKSLWNKYFPDGKPTTQQYILRLGQAHERGEHMPYLFKD